MVPFLARELSRKSSKQKKHHHDETEEDGNEKRHKKATEMLLSVVNADIKHSVAHHNKKNTRTMEAIKRAMQEYAGAGACVLFN